MRVARNQCFYKQNLFIVEPDRRVQSQTLSFTRNSSNTNVCGFCNFRVQGNTFLSRSMLEISIDFDQYLLGSAL